ncbi:stimulus-sensing domain-containing protein [Rhodospira trueperi]|uniref:histidine kinase n=1 Tax=Rhodospira trueperi TaxID=69960 RepID=A0A1G7GBE1_9PROT|nr:stimulus-sensing domain-containing protein [Rhodospira trueperi]SDE85452.1 two-component system, OmpR family, sensor histidine kinase ChvG [Rhodospira trueperi]
MTRGGVRDGDDGAGRTTRVRTGSVLRSRLTWRILAVNLLAPILLVAGMFYLDNYRTTLTQARLQALRTEADLIAAAVAEGSLTFEVHPETRSLVPGHIITPELASQIVRRLSRLAGVRGRLFGLDGALVADSEQTQRGQFLVSPLPPLPEPDSMGDRLDDLVSTVDGLMTRATRAVLPRPELPLYREPGDQDASDYREVGEALAGRPVSSAMRRHPDGTRIVLSVAVPVQYFKQVVGALLVSADDSGIERDVFEVRLAILEIFAGTLAITILMSLYLSGTLVRPLTRLAAAAERVRHAHGDHRDIPDLSNRRDEVGELSAALIEMTAALSARMGAIERFAADVAHEIKNPLTSLRSAVETVARVTDPAQQRRLMAVILDDVERLNRLISDISDASRLDAEMSRAPTQIMDLGPLLAALADVHANTAADSGVSVRYEGPEEGGAPLRVFGNDSRLGQVFQNLLANAVSFSPEGGSVALRAWRAGPSVVATVEDDGPGLPPGKEAAIFDRFYSQRPKGEKFGTHSGLGLSISKQIIENHRGTIRAENRTDDTGRVLGARFTVELPSA